MHDTTYPSVLFSYFTIFFLMMGAVMICLLTIKQGYWGKKSEEPKYRMLEDDYSTDGAAAPRRP